MLAQKGHWPVSGAAFGAAPPGTIPTPTAHWTFANRSGNTLIDEQGSYPGTIVNGCPFVPGPWQRSLSPQDTDSYVGSFGMAGVLLDAISIWFYTPEEITGDYTPSINYGTVGSINGALSLGNFTSVTTGETLNWFLAGATITNGRRRYIKDTITVGWHNLVIKWNGSDYDFVLDNVVRTVYVDVTGSGYSSGRVDLTYLRLGRRYNFDHRCRGEIANVRVYSNGGAGLKNSEVNAIYNETQPGPVAAPTSWADIFWGNQAGFVLPLHSIAALYQDNAGASPVTASGQDVESVLDQSGNGHLFKVTSADNVGLVYTESGGLSYVDFDGTDCLELAASQGLFNFLHNGSGMFVAVVVEPGKVADPNTLYPFLGNNGATSSKRGLSVWWDDRASQSRNNAYVTQVTNAAGVVHSFTSANGAWPSQTTKRLLVNKLPRGNHVVELEGTQVANHAESNTPSTSNATELLRAFGIGGLSFNFAGKGFLLAGRGQPLNGDEKTWVESEMAAIITP